MSDLLSDLLAGEHRALARAITRIENRAPGYRELVSRLHEHAGTAEIVGVTGSPGAGKSTLVDKLAAAYRDRDRTVGIIAIDPASPYTGGAVLGDRIRMGSVAGDMDVFLRSMSARGRLGGLSAATADAVTALDAFGKDVIVIETVGAGQNEVDIVRTADTVVVLVPPESGDAVQMLKAGILEIGDVFVVNKADLPGADRTVAELREMIELGRDRTGVAGSAPADGDDRTWRPPVLTAVARTGEGIEALLSALSDHRDYLIASGGLEEQTRTRFAEQVRTLLREDLGALVEDQIDAHGGMNSLVDDMVARRTDPYTVADELLSSIREAAERTRPEAPEGDAG